MNDRTSDSSSRLTLIVVLLWFGAFLGFFYSFQLPNFSQPNNGLTRMDVWRLVPWDLMDLVDPPQPLPEAISSWTNFPDRIGPLTVAAVVLAAAWALGQLLLRLIGPKLDFRDGERTFFALALGLSGLSLLTLGLGWFGYLSRIVFCVLLGGFVLGEGLFRLLQIKRSKPADPEAESGSAEILRLNYWLILIAPFLLCMLLGALLPSTDFDVKEYHIQGPKEYFQAGRVSFLPHNVYTSFPFGTEMLTLLSMVLLDDWYWGAVAGKVVLMAFGPLTALGIYAAGCRWFGRRAGVYAAAIHLTVPWTYRISTIAYAEGGLTFYLFATLAAVMIGADKVRQHQSAERGNAQRMFTLAGLLAGSAMACKYPGVLSVVIPLGLFTFAVPMLSGESHRDNIRQATRLGLAFAMGTAITIGPWLTKNVVETGNPVYPLMYSVFGGKDWDAELNAKWKAGHSPDTHSPLDLAEKLKDVTLKSDWLSPFLFGLAPLALLLKTKRRLVGWLWAYVGYLFLTWWIFTHRIDRFWVPLIPVVSLLAGTGAAWTRNRVWRIVWIISFSTISLYHLTMIAGPASLCGYNAYLISYDRARQHTENYYSPAMPRLNRDLSPEDKVLCVGNAVVFDARFEVVYDTVFDYSTFTQWFADKRSDLPEADWPLCPVEEIRKKMHDEGITHIYVNWEEILRYRDKGSYGYSDFVSPSRFEELQNLGLLGDPWTIEDQSGFARLQSLSSTNLSDVERWQPSLKTTFHFQPEDEDLPAYRRYQIFPVTID